MSWSATQYSRFEDERTRPVRDLLARLPPRDPDRPVRRAVDLGCGPGNSTALLCERHPDAAVLGLDSSPDMLEAARRRLPAVRFEQGDIARWDGAGGPFDVVLSNAALHWVPDHARLLPALLRALAPGGALAVQVPDNLDEPAHRLMRAVAAEPPWAGRLDDAVRALGERHPAAWYLRLLRAAGAEADVWRTTYHHLLPGGVPAVVEWFKGSGLRPYLDRLEAAERPEFLRRYTARLERETEVLPDGTALLPFPRLFLVATLPEESMSIQT